MAEKVLSLVARGAAVSAEEQGAPNVAATEHDVAFLDDLAVQGHRVQGLQKAFQRLWAEVEGLRAEARWQEMVDLLHPVEERFPEFVEAGLGPALWGEVSFALSHLKRYDAALDLARRCVQECPDDYHAHARLGYVAYDSLYAARNREILLHPEERKARLELAHKHLATAQALRPDNVTQFYRQGMLYKALQNKPDRALPLFQTAVKNWDALDEGQKKVRHQERKNVVKALYQWASCLLALGNPKEALAVLTRCVEEDHTSQYVSMVHKYFALGKVHFALDNYTEAAQALDFAATQADGAEHDYVFELRARIALAQRRLDEAEQALARIPMARRRPYVLWTEADVLAAQGRLEQAKGVLKKAAEKDRRGRHKSLVRLAKIAFRENAIEKCLQWAQEANAFCRENYQNPHDEALFWEAAAYYRLGRMKEAWEAVSELGIYRPRYPHLAELKKKIAQALNAR
ncbi:tetratricopeptide repeat protein [Desulfosoma caldarium]|uniref:Tetratricopeptide repeat protein n=1 Tax=Desulfosoma caldarium TaxID=610254 RepID=A0A3N1UVW1_9BACT|nr:tetratricopeptide repeat protein [Desulfosoma caldarium]ROQ92051.1 tetratricopeptide repeat protein [Desulfosoma caldarium]